MAFDEELATRVRNSIGASGAVAEKRMFGCLVFMLNGNMSVGVRGSEPLVRAGATVAEAALSDPDVRPFDIVGRPMKGWVVVGARAIEHKRGLDKWVRRGTAFAGSLPAKVKAAKR
jgi:hypothetical protein